MFAVSLDFNCFNSYTLSWVDKVATGTESFVSVIVYVGFWFSTVPAIKILFDQVTIRLISQLINGI